MEVLRRKSVPVRALVWVLCVAWVSLTCASGRSAAKDYRGSRTAEQAARVTRTSDGEKGFTLSGWEPSAEFLSAGAPSDTTELDFPEDEEENRKQLIKDISVFVVISAFVGYFIIKVFLEGDTEETPPDDDGKIIPGPTLSN